MTNEQFQELMINQLKILIDEVKEIKTSQLKLETCIENEVIDKIRVLFDAREVQNDRFDRIDNKLDDIDDKIESGYGIPGSEFNAISDPFHHLTATSNNVEGTGIGLTVAKQLVELMGGSIGLESQEGVGSHFWIELTCVEKVSQQVEIPNPSKDWNQEAGHDEVCRILYV